MRIQVPPPTEHQKNEKDHMRKAAVLRKLGFTQKGGLRLKACISVRLVATGRSIAE